MTGPEAIHGLLVVDKPLGWTSMDVVRQVRRAAGGVKGGHAGSLDPLATGVMLVCLGRGTRGVERLMGLPKVYRATIDLAAVTASDDLESPRQEVAVTHRPDEARVRAVLRPWVGTIQQTPPRFSAMKVDGRRAYRLARKGRQVAVRPREVCIDALELLSYDWPLLVVQVTCGRGTYIRSLARDIGIALGTGGHLAALRRLSVGPYDVATAMNSLRLLQPITQADLLAAPAAERRAEVEPAHATRPVRGGDTSCASAAGPVQTGPTAGTTAPSC